MIDRVPELAALPAAPARENLARCEMRVAVGEESDDEDNGAMDEDTTLGLPPGALVSASERAHSSADSGASEAEALQDAATALAALEVGRGHGQPAPTAAPGATSQLTLPTVTRMPAAVRCLAQRRRRRSTAQVHALRRAGERPCALVSAP